MILKGFFLVLLSAKYTASLSCFTCNDVESLESCNSTMKCKEEQSCFTKKQLVGETETFTMGCRDNMQCGRIPVYDTVSKLSKDQSVEKCNECCGTNKCNNELCDHKDPPLCVDQSKQCAYFNNFFDICEDIREASQACRKFCKLCDMVDGKWADWSAWSSCDVTCGRGKHTRTRTCTDPAPAYKGLECEGKNIDTKPCVRQLCPVHGGWTDWSGWGSCPVTCDSGIQKRHRNCTNPAPLRQGDHCFGDAMDVQLCKQKPCNENNSNKSVAFQAYNVYDRTPSASNIVRFTSTLVNIGGGYRTSTGYFNAPISGTYSFNAHICICSGRHMRFDIVVGSTTYAIGYGYDKYAYSCDSVQAVAKLQVNDRVYVKWQVFSYPTIKVLANTAYYRNYFSGVYLSP